MIVFVIHRIGQSMTVMLAAAFIAFGLFHYAGDPISNMVGQDATAEQRQLIRNQLGLDDPFFVQFARFVINAVQGEFGISYRLSLPAADVIAKRLPATLELVATAAVIALAVGIPLGVYTALHRHGFVTRLLLGLSL